MKLHELKILAEYYTEVLTGKKTFELRKNDRDYQVGDLIHFIPIVQKRVKNDQLADTEEIMCKMWLKSNDVYKITYILKDVPQYGLDKDYCILGIKKLEVAK